MGLRVERPRLFTTGLGLSFELFREELLRDFGRGPGEKN
jgi:hypothetical protein